MILSLRFTKNHPWTGLIKYKNCFDYISTYWTRSGNKYTGLTADEAKRLEKELNYEEGQLNPNSKFWIRFAVKVPANGTKIDTSTPEGELDYLFLKSHKRVATSLSEVGPSHDYVLINEESEAVEKNRLNKVRRDAYKELDKLSINDMRKVLRVYGYRSDSMSNELVESKLTDLIEKDPKGFFTKWVDNSSRETEFVLEQAIAKNVIRKNKNIYTYGTDTIGTSKEDVIAFLNSKTNSDIKKAILSEIESK